MKKGIPIGYEDIKRIIDKNMYYIDKTLMIKDLIDNPNSVNLFTRPRRFGKTLNLSMLRRFFEEEHDLSGAISNNRYLFSDLKISACGDKYMSYQGKYPVINLSLKSAKQPTFNMALESMKDDIIQEYERHSYILKGDILSQNEKEKYENIRSYKGEPIDYAKAIGILSRFLYKFHKKNIIILIDEYDVPLENAYFSGFYDEMTAFIRSLFESALKTNPCLEFAVITGCLRISKESIFTGLNNLCIYSVLSDRYSEYYGFTENEVKEMLSYYELEMKYDEIKGWYNGYIFGNSEIYNPWSILNYIENAIVNINAFPKPYWSNTSSNSIIKELIENSGINTRQEVEMLIEEKSIEKRIHEDITYEDIYESDDNLWNFLYFTGYMKKVSDCIRNDDIYVKMAIPNKEIKSIYRHTVMEWFEQKIKKTDMSVLISSLEKGDCDSVSDFISEQLIDTVSFFDYGESYYHGFLSGLLKCSSKYQILSNREMGLGRADIIMQEQKFKGRGIILELKVADNINDMENLCHQALEQIDRQNYTAGLMAEGCNEILKYGICFYKKGCLAICEAIKNNKQITI